MTCAEVFEGMEAKYREFGIKNLYGSFQFNISGPGGGNWNAVCQGDSCRVSAGILPDPDVTIKSSDKVVVKIIEKKMNPALALMTRKIKVKGSRNLINQVVSLLAGKL